MVARLNLEGNAITRLTSRSLSSMHAAIEFTMLSSGTNSYHGQVVTIHQEASWSSSRPMYGVWIRLGLVMIGLHKCLAISNLASFQVTDQGNWSCMALGTEPDLLQP